MGNAYANSLQAVIFDLGNTLIYFDGDWPTIFSLANQQLLARLHALGLKLDETAFLADFRARLEAYYQERDAEFIEYTTAYILNQVLISYGQPPLPDPDLRAVLRAMYAVSQAHWRLEPDAHPTLEVLKEQGYRLGMISNAGDDEDVQTLVDKAGLRAYFQKIISSAAAGIRKPNPRLFLEVASQLGVDPSRTAVVGDLLGADVLGAQNAGMLGILITRRADVAANRAHLDTIHPDAVIDTLADLPSTLQALSAHR